MKILATVVLRDDTRATVPATVMMLAIPGWLAPLEVLVHRTHGGKRGEWSVTERRTHARLSWRGCLTRKAVIDSTIGRLRIEGEERVRALLAERPTQEE